MKKKVLKTKKCRLCNSSNLWSFLDLGYIPVSNELSEKIKKETFPELKILVCKNCWHVQSGSVPISTKVYKNNYFYHTRFSSTISKHFKKNAKKIVKKFGLKNNDLIIDIGGNDGTFLKHFKNINQSFKTLCIEPTIETSNYAKKIGINVFQKFFNLKNSKKIKKKYGIPRAILCTNSFGNIDNLHEFMKGIEYISDEKTIFIFENPYLINTLKGVQFDTMYYEHVSYFSISPLINFFRKFDMEIIDFEKTSVHGGSILVYVKKIEDKLNLSKKIKKIIEEEKNYGLNKISIYKKFSSEVRAVKIQINALLKNLIKKNKKIIAYGASDRGLVLLNYCGITIKQIKYVVDKNPYKHNKYYNGTGMKIRDIKMLKIDQPDYIFLTAWNFKNEIISALKKMSLKSKYIIPLKKPHIQK